MSGSPQLPSYVYANAAAAERARGHYDNAALILNRGGQRAGAKDALGEAARKYATSQALNAMRVKQGLDPIDDALSPKEIRRRMAAEAPYYPQQQTNRHPGIIYTKGKGVDAPDDDDDPPPIVKPANRPGGGAPPPAPIPPPQQAPRAQGKGDDAEGDDNSTSNDATGTSSTPQYSSHSLNVMRLGQMAYETGAQAQDGTYPPIPLGGVRRDKNGKIVKNTAALPYGKMGYATYGGGNTDDETGPSAGGNGWDGGDDSEYA